MDLLLITVLYLGTVLGYILAGIVLGPAITELTGMDTHSVKSLPSLAS